MSTPKPILWGRSLLPAWVPLGFSFGVFVVLRALRQADAPGRDVLAYELVSLGLVLVYLAWLRRKAEVGAEAIRIQWLFYRRTLHYADVRRAVPEGKKRVVLTTMGGETIDLTTGYFDKALPRDVLERLWKAIAAGAEEGSRGTEREMLARSGRTTEAWRAALRELGSPGSYRRSTLSPDRLWAIAENPGIDPEVRAGAVVALSTTDLDAAMRERFQRIGAATVDPSLSALFAEVAAGGEIDEHALEGIRSP